MNKMEKKIYKKPEVEVLPFNVKDSVLDKTSWGVNGNKEGDVKEGSVMIGQISGMLTDVKPCATIIKDIMAETETVIKNLQGLVK